MKNLRNDKGNALPPAQKAPSHLLRAPFSSFPILAACALLFALAGCPTNKANTNTNDSDPNNTTPGDGDPVTTGITVNLRDIALPVPRTREMPVASIAQTAQFTGTVAWSPAVTGAFAGSTAYTATLTLTAKEGYTFHGVPTDFFVVEGATTTNTANSGVVLASFPATLAPHIVAGQKIYIAGYEMESDPQNPLFLYRFAMLWIDGQPLRLSEHPGEAYSVYVKEDGTAYVGGYVAEKGSHTGVALLWTVKEGKITQRELDSGTLPQFIGEADDGTVYVVGHNKFWTVKGNEMTEHPFFLLNANRILSAYVTGDGTVYLAGGLDLFHFSRFWTLKKGENPIETELAVGDFMGTNAIYATKDGTVYVTGISADDTDSALWTVKGNETTQKVFPDARVDALRATEDGTVYLAGGATHGSMLWTMKGAQTTEFLLSASWSGVNSMHVTDDGTAYVVGVVGEMPALWTLSGPTLTSQLFPNPGGAVSVFVR